MIVKALLIVAAVALFAVVGLAALVFVLVLWLTGRKGPGGRDDYSEPRGP
jgi:hypothetical protein